MIRICIINFLKELRNAKQIMDVVIKRDCKLRRIFFDRFNSTKNCLNLCTLYVKLYEINPLQASAFHKFINGNYGALYSVYVLALRKMRSLTP